MNIPTRIRLTAFLLLLCTVCSSLLCGCGDTATESETRAESTETLAVETGTETDSVSASAETQTEPVTRTFSPFTASGSFSSDTGTKLNLGVVWTAECKDGKNVTLTLTATLHCYSILVGARPGMGKIRVGSETYSYSTPSYHYTERTKAVNIEFFSRSFNLTLGENGKLTVPVSVTWPFNGVYGSDETPIGNVTAADTLYLTAP